ncbi:hypothetical protein ACH5RR_007380 [Cinchona calisaya]|uniref:F-box domain-containing protein n=1 Tax=Cinchona calisaya TaxID=153742 RepID=A0ABD3ARS9_9GENT
MATEGEETTIVPKSSVAVPDVPQEIIFEILPWLPVKSLSRFKCVCKPWLSLISSSEFIKTHLKNSSKHNNYALHRLIFQSSKIDYEIPFHGDYILSTYSLHSLLYEGISSIKVVDNIVLDPKLNDHPSHIVGSCNGLICIWSAPRLLTIWNPLTNKSRILPCDDEGEPLYENDTNIPERLRGRSWVMVNVFGYDDVNDDYKVVRAYEDALGVYSLRDHSWKLIDDLPYHETDYFEDFEALVNGNVHWRRLYRDGLRDFPVIISLNLETEKCGEISLPDDLDGEFDWYLKVVEGCLCIVCNCDDRRLEIWVMKEYGVLESWTRVASIPDSEDFRHGDVEVSPMFVSAQGTEEEAAMAYDIETIKAKGTEEEAAMAYDIETITAKGWHAQTNFCLTLYDVEGIQAGTTKSEITPEVANYFNKATLFKPLGTLQQYAPTTTFLVAENYPSYGLFGYILLPMVDKSYYSLSHSIMDLLMAHPNFQDPSMASYTALQGPIQALVNMFRHSSSSCFKPIQSLLVPSTTVHHRYYLLVFD